MCLDIRRRYTVILVPFDLTNAHKCNSTKDWGNPRHQKNSVYGSFVIKMNCCIYSLTHACLSSCISEYLVFYNCTISTVAQNPGTAVFWLQALDIVPRICCNHTVSLEFTVPHWAFTFHICSSCAFSPWYFFIFLLQITAGIATSITTALLSTTTVSNWSASRWLVHLDLGSGFLTSFQVLGTSNLSWHRCSCTQSQLLGKASLCMLPQLPFCIPTMYWTVLGVDLYSLRLCGSGS